MYSTRAFAELTGVTVKALRQAPETRDAWSRRAVWPDGLRRYAASCYEMEPDAWERVVGFIDSHGTR